METIAKWISDNPYLTAAGLFATFLGLIIAIITPIIQRKRKQLYYTVTTTPLVEEKISSIKNLEILFSGKRIEKLCVTNIKVWNSGNTIIESDDFYEGHELVLLPNDKKCTILGTDIIKQSTDTIKFNIDINAKITFQSFEKKDYVLFNVYHTGDANTKFSLDGKMREGKISDKTIDTDEIISLVTEIGSAGAYSIAGKATITFIPFLIVPFISRILKRKKK